MKDDEFNLDAEAELPFPAEADWDNYDEDDSEDYDDDDEDSEDDDDGESHICEPDNWADGDALASAGWGTDEDYGYYGECETYE